MTDLIAEAAAQLDRRLNEAYAGSVTLCGVCSVSRDLRRGDMVCSHALRCAAPLKTSPQALAELLLSRIRLENSFFETGDAVSGFLNFRFGMDFYRALDTSCMDLQPHTIQTALTGLTPPERPFAFFADALGMREALPTLSELRRDGGSPFYHILYTADRYRRLTVGASSCRRAVPASDSERSLCLKLAALPSALARCRETGALSSLCRYLYALSLSARSFYPMLRRCDNDSLTATAQCVRSALSVLTQFFLPQSPHN